MNIGAYIRDHNATITAKANIERYDAIEVTVSIPRTERFGSVSGTGIGDAWDFDAALEDAIAALPPTLPPADPPTPPTTTTPPSLPEKS